MKMKKKRLTFLLILNQMSMCRLVEIFEIRKVLNKQSQLNNMALVRVMFMLLFTVSSTLCIVSCSDNENQKPEQPSGNSSSYFSKTQNIIELQSKLPDQEVQDLPFEDAVNYFGDRLRLCQPEKIILKKDSLFVVLSGGLSQDYKIKWKNNELYLFNDINDSWIYCGIKEGESTFILNCGFYLIKKNNVHGSLSVIGQKYSLLSYSDLIELIDGNNPDTQRQIIWLKIQYKFEKNNTEL